MKKFAPPSLLLSLSLFLTALPCFSQGTINFHNRGLTDRITGNIYNAPAFPACPSSTAQLFLVTGIGGGITYTPIPGNQTFRAFPHNAFFAGPLLVAVPGLPAGTIGVRVVVRLWEGSTFDTATSGSQSEIVTVGPLGGIPEIGVPLTPPNLDGLQSFVFVGGPGFVCVPEPSTLALALLGIASLAFRSKR